MKRAAHCFKTKKVEVLTKCGNVAAVQINKG